MFQCPWGMYGSDLEQLCTCVLLWMAWHGPFGAARGVLVDHCFFVFPHDTSCEQTLQHQKWQPNSPTQCSNVFGGCMEVIWNSSAHVYSSGWRGTAPLGRLEVCSWTTVSSFFSMTHDVSRRCSIKNGSPIAQHSVPMSLEDVWK